MVGFLPPRRGAAVGVAPDDKPRCPRAQCGPAKGPQEMGRFCEGSPWLLVVFGHPLPGSGHDAVVSPPWGRRTERSLVAETGPCCMAARGGSTKALFGLAPTHVLAFDKKLRRHVPTTWRG